MSKVIKMDYSVKEKGSDQVVDSSEGREPLEFISGLNHIIPGLEKEVENMEVGEEKTIEVQPNEAYGEYNPEFIETLPKEQFADIDLQEGMTLYGTGENGETVQVTVKDFDDESVTIDYNHPLAGKTLVFDVKVLNKRDATEEELQSGIVGGLDKECCGDSTYVPRN